MVCATRRLADAGLARPEQRNPLAWTFFPADHCAHRVTRVASDLIEGAVTEGARSGATLAEWLGGASRGSVRQHERNEKMVYLGNPGLLPTACELFTSR